ncbi:MAG: hypothetical protein FJ215_08625 [Ignavibacteria bacterium]|nr:hypothetical protein [Ignavibacteria bacterium]
MKSIVTLLALLGGLVSIASSQSETPSPAFNIIPTPRTVQAASGHFKIGSQTKLILGSETSKDDLFAAEELNSFLEELKGISLKVSHENALRKLSPNHVFIGRPTSPLGKQLLNDHGGKLTTLMKDEGYFLGASDEGIAIIAESPRGRYYGVMTLLQIISRQRNSLVVPCGTIHDWPALRMRGISDDISRGQVSTLENFKKIIRFLSRHKLNTYALYMEDMFLLKSHPVIGVGRGALSAADVRELDSYAKQRHVELVPIFQTLGHWENILILPEYRRYAEFPGAHVLNVTDESIYKLLDQMVAEVSQAFSSPYLHIGADESWDVGLGASKARVAASNLATVHAEHYRRVFAIAKKYKKKPIIYGDILLDHPEILDKIPKDVVVMDWQYHVAPEYPGPAVITKAGFPLITSPAIWNFTGPFPNYLNSFVNIRTFSRDAGRVNALGTLTATWNDYGGEALRELNYLGYAWSAQCIWNGGESESSGFNGTFFEQFFGNAKAGRTAEIVYMLLSSPTHQYTWHDLWRHPLLPPKSSPLNILWRRESIDLNMPLAERLLENLQQSATRNADHLQYLRFISRLNRWYAMKQQVADSLRRIAAIADREGRRRTLAASMVGSIDKVLLELQALKAEFRWLWMLANREPNLDLLMKRYDRQSAYWQEIRQGIVDGSPWENPLIESKWITHPAARPQPNGAPGDTIGAGLFQAVWNVPEGARSATVQLMGETHARLRINGVEMGEVCARRSLSLTVEHERIKVFDITNHLQAGENAIAIDVTNYNQGRSAAVNVYAELVTRDGKAQTFVSDSTWWVSTPVRAGEKIQAVEATGVPEVIRPNFAARRYSWIER